MENIIIKLLDWPFLFFVFLIIFIIVFRKQLLGILNRGDITISWGDGNNIRIAKLSEELDKELDPIKDDINLLKEKIEKITTGSINKKATNDNIESIALDRENDAKKRILDILRNGEYKWRSIDRLSFAAGLPVDKTTDILRSDPDITLSLGKSGRSIVKLKSR